MSSYDQKRRIQRICCIGAGYVGGPSGAVIANKNPDIQITIVDLNVERIQAWNSEHLPVYEPGLFDLVKTARDGIPGTRQPNLIFSTDVDRAIATADLIFLGVNTPTKVRGLGAGRASDLGWLEAATRRIAKAAEKDIIVVEKSTVPCRTAASLREILRANGKPGVNFEVLSNPEFLAEGTAIKNLLNPDRLLIGCLQTESGWAAANALADVYASWVPRSRVVTMNLWSSELAKLAANAMLAQRISSINALSAVCEATGANINEISYACGLDSRIGPKMLQSSVGFGGSCFKKDVLNLVYMAESLNLPEVAAYWESVVTINEYQKSRFTRRIINSLHGTLSGKKIAVLGFAYKKDTGDTRESTAITVVNNLLAENARVSIYDPKVTETQIMRDLSERNSDIEALKSALSVCADPYDACQDAHAVVILTEWDMFSNKTPTVLLREGTQPSGLRLQLPLSPAIPIIDVDQSSATTDESSDERTSLISSSSSSSSLSSMVQSNVPKAVSNAISLRGDDELPGRLNWSKIALGMQRPMYVFDGRNIIDADKLRKLGMVVEAIGVASSLRLETDLA